MLVHQIFFLKSTWIFSSILFFEDNRERAGEGGRERERERESPNRFLFVSLLFVLGVIHHSKSFFLNQNGTHFKGFLHDEMSGEEREREREDES